MVYGIIVEQSVGALLLAGFVPGIISAVVYAEHDRWSASSSTLSLGRPITGITWDERLKSLPEISPDRAGGDRSSSGRMYSGWATPTEAGALGAFSVFVMALLRHGHALAATCARRCSKRPSSL